MAGFSPYQRRQLQAELDPDHVRTRVVDGKTLDYIEGWFAMAEANAIFGFDAWDRETVHLERVLERSKNDKTAVGYVARVRVKVRAGQRIVVREGSGWGFAESFTWADAHERAFKAAETDAMKRALVSFGSRFGLHLYDNQRKSTGQQSNRKSFALFADEGEPLASNLSGEAFCAGLKQLIEAARNEEELNVLLRLNEPMLEKLRREAPHLRSSKGLHFAEILRAFADRRRDQLRAKGDAAAPTVRPGGGNASGDLPGSHAINGVTLLANPSRIALGPAIDKSALSRSETRRVRDKSHLRLVSSRPCLICEATPCHAHHLTFAQPRGLSVKVSDEFTVPLCVLHHNEVHRPGTDEPGWWHAKGIDALARARGLWEETTATSLNEENRSDPVSSQLDPGPTSDARAT